MVLYRLDWNFVKGQPYRCCANIRFKMLTIVAAPMALPTTAQYIFCIVRRLGAPSLMDIAPMGMSLIKSMVGGGCG